MNIDPEDFYVKITGAKTNEHFHHVHIEVSDNLKPPEYFSLIVGLLKQQINPEIYDDPKLKFVMAHEIRKRLGLV